MTPNQTQSNDNGFKEKLLNLFNLCINDKDLHLKEIIKPTVSSTYYNNAYFNRSVIRKSIRQYTCHSDIEYQDYAKTLKQHDLYEKSVWYENYQDVLWLNVSFNFADLPKLTLTFEYKAISTEQTDKLYRTKLGWFNTKEIKVNESFTIYEPFYKLTHGSIEANITAEEGLELIANYNSKNKFFFQENDNIKLDERLKEYSDNK
jgi:hypothetical protein